MRENSRWLSNADRQSTMMRFSYQIISTEPLRVRDIAGEEKFTGMVAQHCSKVYVVSDRGRIVYVGSSKQPLRNRLYGALRSKGQSGYFGYAWKKSTAALTLDVWVLDGVRVEKGKRCVTAETVEAEVVFLIRERDGNWPKHQTEIHFHPSEPRHREIAATIYEEIRKRA
ncbi:MAG: hypothetical protein HYV96_09090 [Opitutae bacterium]|nr:hypothetical protein [Opitutae bacterium]